MKFGGPPVIRGAPQPAVWPISASPLNRTTAPLCSKGPAGSWDAASNYDPSVIRNVDGTPYVDEDGFYHVYYAGTDVIADDDKVGLFKTKDFRRSVKVGSAPVLPLGGVGAPDRGDAQSGSCIFDGTTFHVFYTGNSTAPGAGADNCTVCYATGTVPGTLTKQGRIINVGPSDDSGDIYSPRVCRGHDGGYKMAATGHNAAGEFGAMMYTCSTLNGVWARASNNFVFRPSADIYIGDFGWSPTNECYWLLYAKNTSAGFETWVASAATPTGTWSERRKLLGPMAGAAWDSGGKYNCQMLDHADGRRILIFNTNAYVEGIGISSVTLGGTAPTLTSTQPTYTNAQQLSFPFTEAPLPANPSAWIGVFASGVLADWRWTDNVKTGNGTGGIAASTVTFPADTFDPGSYTAKMIFDGFTIATVGFSVSS